MSFNGIFFMLCTLLLACEAQQFTPVDLQNAEEQEGIPQKTLNVDLPPLINLSAKTPSLKNQDGSFRVEGLKFYTTKYVDEDLTITAYLLEKYKEAQEGITQPSHLWIGDDPDSPEDKRMRVVGVDEKVLAKLKVGTFYQFTGKLVQKSPQGYISTDGILIYQSAEVIKK
jgi:hypothetical protein